MSDEAAPTETVTSSDNGAATAGETQAVVEGSAPAQAQAKPTAQVDLSKDLIDAQARIKHLNSESAKHRKAADEYKAQLEAIASEREKLAAEIEQVRAEAKQAKINNALATAVQGAGFTKPIAQALKLIDLSAIQLADDGSVKGIDDAIKALMKDWPELFPQKQAPSTDAGSRGKGSEKTYGGKTLTDIAKKYNISPAS